MFRIGFTGSETLGYGMPSVRGSVIMPVRAEAAAVFGLSRQTLPSRVPDLPGKFRGTVRRLILPVAGAWPIPIQPLQP